MKRVNDFNQLITIAATVEKDKKTKKGSSLSSVLSLVQDLTAFEENIQDCIDAQESQEDRAKIESFLGTLDKMYDVLFQIARDGVRAIRSQRQDVIEEIEPKDNNQSGSVTIRGDDTKISYDDLKKYIGGSDLDTSLQAPIPPRV